MKGEKRGREIFFFFSSRVSRGSRGSNQFPRTKYYFKILSACGEHLERPSLRSDSENPFRFRVFLGPASPGLKDFAKSKTQVALGLCWWIFDLLVFSNTGAPSQFLKSQLLRPILEKHSLFRLSKVKCRNCILSKVLQIFRNLFKKMGKFSQKLVVRQFLRATLEKHSLFALSKEDFWNRDPCLDFLRKIYLRNWLGVPVFSFMVCQNLVHSIPIQFHFRTKFTTKKTDFQCNLYY